MFIFQPGIHYHSIWFVAHNPLVPPPARCDWMAMVWRDPQEGWCLTYRFRYHTGGEEPEADDHRNWYEAKGIAEITKQMIDGVHLIAKMTAVRNHTNVDYVRVDGDHEKAMGLLMGRPWFHVVGVEEDDE